MRDGDRGDVTPLLPTSACIFATGEDFLAELLGVTLTGLLGLDFGEGDANNSLTPTKFDSSLPAPAAASPNNFFTPSTAK